ncbi:ScbA/BarX family gamma-butyrolactone biosynthesis protein [Streptomyces sp. BE303]|uniref:ScbA/BarX family gamma-butyrolactone biosynthesis protein n=2 Tax=Streptomycetaceae TaxID=2062 RepID=UPI002E76070B|nr:ScbA/BarX family gamma-butyrolactone biosynthesis protein [Streptomyces sp. BE303]MED7948268.1 ScbA/BarX family gamma-butyrolactone biosynthesis protein [Streptomyces sp. BE303]
MFRTDHSTTMTSTEAAAVTGGAPAAEPVAPGSGPTAVRNEHVPKEHVHKRAADEVLLTGWERVAEDSYRVSARWPRDHRAYAARHGHHDPMLLVETVRQTFPLLSHAAFEVPLGHHLIWDHFSYALIPGGLRTGARDAVPAQRGSERAARQGRGYDEVQVDAVCQDLVRRGNRVVALTLAYVVTRDGEPIATAQTRFTVQTPAIYRRLRAGRGDAGEMMARAVRLAPPIPVARAGRALPREVALSATDRARRWQLRVDTNHPVHFDHPVDHAPGSLLLDAARQAAQALSHPAPVVAVAMECDFTRYVELDEPCMVEVTQLPRDPARRDRVGVILQQGTGAPSCSVIVTVAPLPTD